MNFFEGEFFWFFWAWAPDCPKIYYWNDDRKII